MCKEKIKKEENHFRVELKEAYNRENVLTKIFPRGRETWVDKSGRLHMRALKWKKR